MIIGISILKRTSFRGGQQEFTNVYHYELPTAVTVPWTTLVNEIVAMERNLHSSDVTFVKARGWTAGGTAAENEMLHEQALSGLGTSVVQADMDRERTVLIQWPAGRNRLGRPVFLRKWYHTCGQAGGVAFPPAVLQQTAQISSANRATIVGFVDGISEIGTAEVWGLCGPNGRNRSGQPVCHPYLEHHQLGDQWR